MPVTARLSRKFYDKFGDDITNELVDWSNQVDSTYRINLQEMNDRNFERFDSRLGERAAGIRESVNSQIGKLCEEMVFEIARLRKEMLSEMGGLREEMRSEIGKLHRDLTALEARTDGKLADTRTSLVKWMFVFWTGTAVTNMGMMFVLAKLLTR